MSVQSADRELLFRAGKGVDAPEGGQATDDEPVNNEVHHAGWLMMRQHRLTG